jgi:DNA repair protein RadC
MKSHFARDVLGQYQLKGPQTEEQILEAAAEILSLRLFREAKISDPRDTERYLQMKLAGLQHEEFHAIWLDQKHAVLGFERLASGDISGASIHPRQVVLAALRANAAAVIFSHNHPSQNETVSGADKAITRALIAALELIEVRVLDHLVVTAGKCSSFAAMGLL